MSRINPKPNRSIVLESYDGNEIDNLIDDDPSPGIVALTKAHNPYHRMSDIKELTPPTGRYNCHGLVFASRRTAINVINHPVNIDELLKSDRFRRTETPQVGDIIVYRQTVSDEIDHTGFVSRIEKIGDTPIIFIWSKWGCLGEYEHKVMLCTFYKDCKLEYWRLEQ